MRIIRWKESVRRVAHELRRPSSVSSYNLRALPRGAAKDHKAVLPEESEETRWPVFIPGDSPRADMLLPCLRRLAAMEAKLPDSAAPQRGATCQPTENRWGCARATLLFQEILSCLSSCLCHTNEILYAHEDTRFDLAQSTGGNARGQGAMVPVSDHVR
jgi:hypothetical protein